MENQKPPNDYQPFFEDLKWINDGFVSYETLASKFNKYLSLKDENSLQSYIDELDFKLYQIEWDIWNHQRDEDYKKDIILRLNLILDNSQNLIPRIKSEIESILTSSDEGFGTYEEYYEKLRQDPVSILSKIKDNRLKNNTQYLVLAGSTKTIIKNYLEKIESFVKTGTDSKFQTNLKWLKSDTNLLELIVALLESNSINNNLNDLTQKEAFNSFATFFQKELKDSHKKLNAARNRKKDEPSFLIKLDQFLQDYYAKLDSKDSL